MVKGLVAVTLGAAMSACAAQPAAPPATAARSATTTPAAKSQAQAPGRKVCKTVEDETTGSKITTRRVCHEVVDGGAKQPQAE
ncbi:MAG: hypothetical protein ABIO69_05890 [Sphingomicrobium sp.]